MASTLMALLGLYAFREIARTAAETRHKSEVEESLARPLSRGWREGGRG